MKIQKPYTNQQYAELAIYCNQNNCHIEDKETYLESVANPPAPELTYAQKRVAEYPDMAEYLDAMVKINSGDETFVQAGQIQLATYIADCLAVKTKYPKN